MKIYLLIIITGFLLGSCSDDSKRLSPSYQDINWFEIEDSKDEIDHLRYCIYEKTMISIYYNNKLGEQERGEDAFGDKIIHEEFLLPEYQITKSAKLLYSFPRNREYIKEGILFVRDEIIPAISPKLYPRSILLVESLAERVGLEKKEQDVYLGSMALIISKVGKLHEMSEVERKSLQIEACSHLWYKYIRANCKVFLDNFYRVSKNSVVWPSENTIKEIYEQAVRVDVNNIPYKKHWNGYGFLICHPDRQVLKGYMTPTKEQDIYSFIKAVLEYNDTEFIQMYEDKEGKEFLIEKYQLVKSMMNKVKEVEK